MSTYNFIRSGSGKLLLEVPPHPPFPTIKVYDIQEPQFVGVEYPGKDRQAQPRIWWEERLRKAGTPPPLLKIQPRKRPEAKEPSAAAAVHAAPPSPRAILKIKPRKRPS